MKKDFIKNMQDKFFLRFHMSIMLMVTILSGVGFSKLSLYLGWNDLTSRYLVSFLFSYLSFLGAIRLWLWYVLKIAPTNNSDLNDLDYLDLWVLSSSSKKYKGEGGSFSGGGSSSSWGESSSVFKDIDLDVDGDAAPLLLVIGLVFLILIVFFGGFYLLVEAPVFLGEIAFDLALSAGILKSKDKLHPVSWLATSFKKTIIPVVIISIIIITLGLTINHYNPDVTNSAQLLSWILN